MAIEIATMAGVFASGGSEAAVMVAALFSQTAVVVMFLHGSQKHEERQELGLPLVGGYDTSIEGDEEMGARDAPGPDEPGTDDY